MSWEICVIIYMNIVVIIMSIMFFLVFQYVKSEHKRMKSIFQEKERYRQLFLASSRWIDALLNNENISQKLLDYNYKKIAIYGMGRWGKSLLKMLLAENSIEVAYGIDIRGKGIYTSIPVYSLDEKLDDVDAVVVTTVANYDQVKDTLSSIMSCNILSLEDILYSTSMK